MRMPHAKFAQLADMLSESIKKQDTPLRMAILPRAHLALMLRFLVTGESFKSLSFQFRIGKATVSEIVQVDYKSRICDTPRRFLPFSNVHMLLFVELFTFTDFRCHHFELTGHAITFVHGGEGGDFS